MLQIVNNPVTGALFIDEILEPRVLKSMVTQRRSKLAKKDVKDSIFRFRISLVETDPLVWRRILVRGSMSLEALHSVFQLAMGWQMSHLFEFRIGGIRYTEESEFDEEPPASPVTSIATAFGKNRSFEYIYDFGDNWRHHGEVEEIMPHDDRFHYPVCIGGENACPPEDCGGISAYDELKKVITDQNHPEYGSTIRWLGGCFEPTSFDVNRINRDLLWATNWKKGPNDQGLYHPFNFGE